MKPNRELLLYASVGALFTIAIPPLFPSFKLYYLIPFMIRSFYIKSMKRCLIYSLLVGVFLDLFSSHVRFGIASCSYMLATATLYSRKQNFFEDQLSTLPCMTLFYSILITVFQWILLLILDRQYIKISLQLVAVDFIFMPLADLLFASLIFVLPAFIFGKPAKKGSDYFFERG